MESFRKPKIVNPRSTGCEAAVVLTESNTISDMLDSKAGPISDLTELRSEGDVNLSVNRQAWTASEINAETRRLLEEDARYFLHQSLSTPCLNALKSCNGATITDWQDRELLDFHGNSVHQVGFGNPLVIEAI